MTHNSGRREEERRIEAEISEPEKPHKGTRGRAAPDHRDGAGARAARYRRAPEPGSEGGCKSLGQAHGKTLIPRTRRRNGDHALLRVLRIHTPVPQGHVWLAALARVLNPERRAV